MYQALVRLPNSDSGNTPPAPGFDWSAFIHDLMRRLFRSASRR